MMLRQETDSPDNKYQSNTVYFCRRSNMHVINHLFKEVQENEHTAAVYEKYKINYNYS